MSPTSEFSSDGLSLDPLEVMFIKVKRHMLLAHGSPASRGAAYEAWQRQAAAWPPSDAQGGRSFAALESNAFVDSLHEHKAPRVLEARARGVGCFDLSYYAKENPDLKHLWRDPKGLWRHFVYYGQVGSSSSS